MIRSTVFLVTTINLVLAHGGIDDSDGDAHTPAAHKAPGTAPAQGNLAFAFGLVALSVACSTLGSFLPFLDVLLPRISTRFRDFRITESNIFVSSLLAFASGIMIFLSLGDLYPDAVKSWSQASFVDPKHAGIIVFAMMAAVFAIMSGVQYIFQPRRHRFGSEAESDEGKLIDSLHDRSPQLRRLGVQVAIGLAIHNFPEGLAIFTLALTSAKIGVIFGIALALHKIPEGMIIALPIYAATRSRVKAFLFATAMATLTQILGAVLGYMFFVTYWSMAVSGTLFAIAVALLAWVVLVGMIPLARSLDPADVCVSKGLLLGVLFFALVNALFRYT